MGRVDSLLVTSGLYLVDHHQITINAEPAKPAEKAISLEILFSAISAFPAVFSSLGASVGFVFDG